MDILFKKTDENKRDVDKNKKIKVKNNILEWVYIILGSFLVAVAINFFFLPNKITNGGASGIATIFYYFYQIPMGLTVMIINIPLFIISIWKLGIKFSIRTIISTTLLSIFLEIIKLENIITTYQGIEDYFIAAIFGGLILGIGLSFVFKGNASTGGSDLLANIIYKVRKNVNLSTILLTIDAAIIIFSIIAFKSINIGLYSIIGIFVSNKVIDLLFEGINFSKAFYIITDKNEEIIRDIEEILERGSTTISGIGSYSDEECRVIISVVERNQVSKMKSIIYSHDKNAFVYITTAHEVIGNGFKEIK